VLLLGAIADDVTGAADLASTLTREGMRTVQVLGPEPPDGLRLPDADAVVVALKSRTAPVAEAVRDSTAALAWLRDLGVRQVFFKYCSTFDSTPAGNIGPVADALLHALGTDFTVVCPAYPANGRTVYRGHLFVGERLLSESSLARHPLTPMTDPDLVRVLACQTSRRVGLVPYEIVAAGSPAIETRLDELRRQGVVYAVVDALDDEHLRALGEACAGLPLVTGGAGVALGLPANFRAQGLLGTADAPAELSSDGPAVVLAGSCSEATREQVRRLAELRPAFRIDPLADVDVAALGDQLLARLADGPVLVYSAAPPDEVSRAQERLGVERASELVEATLAGLARHLVAGGARRLVLAGGETSAAVLQALGVRALAVGPELAPGVPWMRTLGEPELTVALKSGNFGGPDFFLEAVA
jgi:3-dehydrotetronate 4-kinase